MILSVLNAFCIVIASMGGGGSVKRDFEYRHTEHHNII